MLKKQVALTPDAELARNLETSLNINLMPKRMAMEDRLHGVIMSDALGAEIKWDAPTETITLTLP